MLRINLKTEPKPKSIYCPEIQFKEDVSNCCKGCGKHYADKNVMIVSSVGPVCLNCLYNIAAWHFQNK